MIYLIVEASRYLIHKGMAERHGRPANPPSLLIPVFALAILALGLSDVLIANVSDTVFIGQALLISLVLVLLKVRQWLN